MNSRQATDIRGSMVAEWHLVFLCFFPSCFMVPLVDILSTRGTFFGKTWYWQLAHHGKEWDVPRECSVSARSSVNFISLGLGVFPNHSSAKHSVLTPSLLPSSSLTVLCSSGIPCGCLFSFFSYPTNSLYSLHQLTVVIRPCERQQLMVSQTQYAGWALHKNTARAGRQDFKYSQVVCSAEGLSVWKRQAPFPNHKQQTNSGGGQAWLHKHWYN